MKHKISTFLIAFVFITSFFGQPPNAAPSNDSTNFSNNKILTMDDMVFNTAISPLKKVPLDTNSILIYDYDGSLFSYNLTSQTTNWSTKATDPDRQMCGNKLTLLDGVIYVPFINGELFALDNQTGKPFWKTRLGNIKEGIIVKNQTPMIEGNQLYITTQYDNSNIYAIDIQDGGLIWNYHLAYPYNHLPVLYFKNRVITQNAPYVYSFEAKTGKPLYQKQFQKAMYGKPVTDGTRVIIANESQALYALSADNLEVLWEFQLAENQYNIKENIFCKDDRVFVGTNGSDICSVYAVNTENGSQIWKTDFKEDDIAYITEFKEALWGYTDKGILFKLDLTNGKKLQEFQLKNQPISNFEFKDSETLFYYCEAGLIQYNTQLKTEELIYIRSSIDEDASNAYIKLLR